MRNRKNIKEKLKIMRGIFIRSLRTKNIFINVIFLF